MAWLDIDFINEPRTFTHHRNICSQILSNFVFSELFWNTFVYDINFNDTRLTQKITLAHAHTYKH